MTHSSTYSKPDDKGASGCLFIVSAPSGAGKSTLCRAARKRFAALTYAVSHPTRPPRAGEKNGVDYYFISHAEFEKKIRENAWAEWAKVHGHYYGTSAELLNHYLARGTPVLLDIDVAGTRQILERFPDSITIFIMPPSLAELERRLKKRGADDGATIEKRLKNADAEMARRDLYRYIIINDQLNQAIEEFCAIIERHSPGRALDAADTPTGQGSAG